MTLISILFILLAHQASGATPFVTSRIVTPGDTVAVRFAEERAAVASATFDGAPAALFPYRSSTLALFGIPPTKRADTYPLRVVFANGDAWEEMLAVRPGRIAKIILPVPPQIDLTPENLVQKLAEQKDALAETLNLRTPEVFFSAPFGLPLRDNRKVSSPFGEIRKTGSQEIRHLGTDFEAPRGAAVGAINAGIIRKSYADPVYGESVIVDHGEGIFSLYLHLDRRLAREGQTVKRGALIGMVGASGLASAPHLHLSVKIGEVPVDPLRFVRAFARAVQ